MEQIPTLKTAGQHLPRASLTRSTSESTEQPHSLVRTWSYDVIRYLFLYK